MFIVGQEYPRDDLKNFAETKAQQTGILYKSGAKPDEVKFVILTSGGKAKNKLGYEDREISDGKWEYFGQGTEGNQDPSQMANRMLLNKGSTKLLFSTRQPTSAEIKSRGHERKRYKFEGAYEFESWSYFEPEDGERKCHQLICVTLSPVGEIPLVAETACPDIDKSVRNFSEASNDELNTRVLVPQVVRAGQQKFKNNLMEAYGGKCTITGTSVKETLIAAHVYDHAKSGVNALDNGMLLRADIHNLFDCGLLRVNPNTLKIELNEALKTTEYAPLDGKKIRPRTDKGFPSKEYLGRKYQPVRAD